MRGVIISLSYFLLVNLFITGCQIQGKGPTDPDKKEVTQRDLYRAARSQQKILLVDGWADKSFQDNLRQLIKDFHSDRWEIVVKDHKVVTAQEIASTPTMLIGTPRHNFWIEEILPELPFKISEMDIIIDDRSYAADEHSIVLSYYPNPLNVRMPIGMVTSNSEPLILAQVSSRITSFVRANWNYEIMNGNRKILLGNFSQQEKTRWELDSREQIELPISALHTWKDDNFIFNSYHQSLDPKTVKELTQECQRELRDISKLSGVQLTEPIHYFLYPSTEMKGLMTGSTDQSHMVVEGNEVHTAFDTHFDERYFGKENQLIIRQLLGVPDYPALEIGLAVYFSSHWEKEGFQYWAKHLIESGNSMTIAQLLEPEVFSNASSLIREALSGSLVDHLIVLWGKEQFVEKYRNWEPDESELNELNKSWWSSVKSASIVHKPAVRSALPYLKGFNYTHEGYQIYNGYGSNMSSGSLDKVKKLGSNAVAIVPFSWMRDPTLPTSFRFSQRAGSENHESIIHTITNAKQRDLFTILKPHVWISGSWPGEVKMSSEQDWELFFENYYQWISHYALMAEMHDVDALCVGVEFSAATLTQEAHWRKLIQKIRQIYSGNLTYAANWGDEFENIRFWDQLDFIGVNCYYPLSSKPNASRTELQKGFDLVLDKMAKVKSKYNKPLLVTEIGFRSVEAPWLQPHEEAGEKKFNENDQAASYSVVFEGISNRPVIDGIFWWKWPTNIEHGDVEDRRFIPTGKKTEAVIEKWFNNSLDAN